MNEKGKRMAVLVGCNYPNTKNELHGCHNDVLAMKEVLISRFMFDPNNIELLIDKQGGSDLVMPNGANIMKALHKMVDQAKNGDVLYFHYSGHGTLLNKPFLPFLKEEAIVPIDFNLITSKFLSIKLSSTLAYLLDLSFFYWLSYSRHSTI